MGSLIIHEPGSRKSLVLSPKWDASHKPRVEVQARHLSLSALASISPLRPASVDIEHFFTVDLLMDPSCVLSWGVK